MQGSSSRFDNDFDEGRENSKKETGTTSSVPQQNADNTPDSLSRPVGTSRPLSSFVSALGLGVSLPPVTFSLIALCVLVYLLDLFFPSLGNAFVFAPILGHEEPYRFLTSAFLHSDFWHIFLNMYALALLGVVLEPALGKWRFLGVYVLSALAGNMFVLVLAQPMTQAWVTGTVGASGAVFGLFGTLLVLQRNIGADVKSILILIGINLAVGFLPNSHISWQAHVGGLIMGMLVAVGLIRGRSLFDRVRRRARTATASMDVNRAAVFGLIRDIAVFLLAFLVLVFLFFWCYR